MALSVQGGFTRGRVRVSVLAQPLPPTQGLTTLWSHRLVSYQLQEEGPAEVLGCQTASPGPPGPTEASF